MLHHPLFALLGPLLATHLLPEAVGSPYSEGLWVTCTVDEAALAANATLQKETLADISRVRCISLAAFRGWPFLACWTEGRQCTLWGLKALAAGKVVPGPALQADCLMPKDFDGCLAQDGSLKLGTQTEFEYNCTGGYTYGCVNLKYEIKVTPSDKLTSCRVPFLLTSHGCIFINTQLLSWSSARLTCLNYGADLYVPITPQAYVSFTDYLKANHASTTADVWMGVQMLPNRVWQWLDGRSLDPLEAPGPMGAGTGEYYARAHRGANDQTMADNPCWVKMASICLLKY